MLPLSQMKQLQEFSRRIDWLRGQLRSLPLDTRYDQERRQLRHELRELLVLTCESPRSLRKRCENFRK